MEMELERIFIELETNKEVFKSLLDGLSEDEYLWRAAPDKWCLLEIICHLYDEESEDFKARVNSVLEDPEKQFSSIDPGSWVTEREYIDEDYENRLESFICDRTQSVDWLRSLKDPKWDNVYNHPKLGKMSAKMILSNWLAHDYLHIRQVLSLKFAFHKEKSGEPLTYAGNW